MRLNPAVAAPAARLKTHTDCRRRDAQATGYLFRPARRVNVERMIKMQTALLAGFTPGERDYIRRELDMFFSTLPTVVEGFQLKTWRGGLEAGKPKLSPVAKGLLERGLMRLDTSQRLPRLFFTDAGLTELRTMMADRRLADPKKFAHVRQELGIDPVPEADGR
jgi:hypothetical protein